MSDNMKLATPDNMLKIYRGEKTCITATRVPGISAKTITGWVFPKEMHDFLQTMQTAANWYVYAITKPSETTNLAGLSNCVPEFNRWHCALVLKPEYIDRYFVMCSDRMELGVLETMFGMDQDGDDIIILKEETIPDPDVDDISTRNNPEEGEQHGQNHTCNQAK